MITQMCVGIMVIELLSSVFVLGGCVVHIVKLLGVIALQLALLQMHNIAV